MINYGALTEDAVTDCCKNSFLADFVVRNPKLSKLNHKKIEIADILLPYRDNLIAFQVKARVCDTPIEQDDSVELMRISSKIDAAINQVKTIKRALNHLDLKYVTNLRGIRIPLNIEGIMSITGVVVVDIVDSTGNTKSTELELLQGIDMIQGITVHVFLRSHFEYVLKEMDTIPDFLTYLNTRARLIRRGQLLPFTTELDFLGLYITQGRVIEECLQDDSNILAVVPGYWEDFLQHNGDQYKARHEFRRNSYLIDRIIEEVHRCIGYCLTDEYSSDTKEYFMPPGRASISNYMTIAQILAAKTRTERIALGNMIFEKMLKADSDPKGYSFAMIGPQKIEDEAFPILFMASRENRIDRYNRLCKIVCAAATYFNYDSVIGIATESASSTYRTTDFMFVSGSDIKMAEDFRELASKLFAPSNVFRQTDWPAKK